MEVKVKVSLCSCQINHLNPELNPICYLLALLAHHFLHVSRIRVKSLTIRLLMSYIYDISNLRVKQDAIRTSCGVVVRLQAILTSTQPEGSITGSHWVGLRDCGEEHRPLTPIPSSSSCITVPSEPWITIQEQESVECLSGIRDTDALVGSPHATDCTASVKDYCQHPVINNDN